jgi:hypothetical protein
MMECNVNNIALFGTLSRLDICMLMSTFLYFYAAYDRHESENMKVLCADTDGIVRSEIVASLILKISAKEGGGGKRSVLHLCPFTSEETEPDIYRIGGWICNRTCLDVFRRRKFRTSSRKPIKISQFFSP